jgi:hypothetical protein
MKTIIALLLLPTIVLAQIRGPHQKEHYNIEFSIGFDMESSRKNEIDITETLEGTLELFVTVEVYIEELLVEAMTPQFMTNDKVVNAQPKYLSTLSLSGLHHNATESHKPQKRLDRLLALNDTKFPQENTLLDWLHPVRYEHNKSVGLENIPEGFGPRIRY